MFGLKAVILISMAKIDSLYVIFRIKFFGFPSIVVSFCFFVSFSIPVLNQRARFSHISLFSIQGNTPTQICVFLRVLYLPKGLRNLYFICVCMGRMLTVSVLDYGCWPRLSLVLLLGMQGKRSTKGRSLGQKTKKYQEGRG